MIAGELTEEVVGRENPYTLSASLSVYGHTLTQVFRKKRIAIYARSLPNREPHEFELIVIQERPEGRTPTGSLVKAHEGYPKNSEWGRFGWSFPIRDREFVWALAEQMTGFEGPYGQWVREQFQAYKATEEFRQQEARFAAKHGRRQRQALTSSRLIQSPPHPRCHLSADPVFEVLTSDKLDQGG